MIAAKPDIGRRFATVVLALALAACVPAERVADSEVPGGGIGGTGIIGTVTGFGSIHVNGVRIETGETTEFISPLAGRTLDDLAVGHVVEVAAERSGGTTTALRVAEIIALAGPVAEMDMPGATLRILGVAVDAADAEMPADLAEGEMVAVSGLWRGERLVASRLDRIAPESPAIASGVLSFDPLMGLRVGGVAVVGVVLGRQNAGSFVTAAGRAQGGRFLLTRVVPGRPALGTEPLRQLSVEGFLVKGAQDGHFELSGLGRPLDESARVEPVAAGRAVLLGRLGQTFAVEHGVPLPDDAEGRAAALDALGDGLAPRQGALDLR